MKSRTWSELVAEGRRLITMEGDIKWQLGDLALEVAPMGGTHATNGATEKLERFAEEIGVEYEALRKYRRVAAAWPDGKRFPSAAWSVHDILAGRPDRFRLIKSLPRDERGKVKTTEAWRAIGQKVGASHTNLSSPQSERVEAVKQYLDDPSVRRALVRDDKVRAEWSRTEREEDSRVAARVARKLSESAPRLVEAREFYEALADVSYARRRLQHAIRTLADLPPLSAEERAEFNTDMVHLEACMDYLRALMKGRRPASLADEVEEFLAAEAQS
jgi:hypothetical protein